MPDTLLDSVRSQLQKPEFMPPGSRVVVAVSGGQDSCALLHSLASLRSEFALSLHAAHLNHGFRGEEAAKDADLVRDLAYACGVPCTVETEDVPAIASRLRLSNQEAARRARYQFLNHVSDSIGADRIALGHTRDDKVETVLMNILRGTGIDGLAGISARNDRIVRPLLGLTRRATAEYCRKHGIASRTDESNNSTKYTRNRIRAELLPELESHYNPAVRSALLRLSYLAEQDSQVLEEVAAVEFKRCLVNRSEGCVVLSSERVLGLPTGIQRRIVRQGITELRGNLYDVDAAAVDRTLAALVGNREKRFQFTLPNGDISVEVHGSTVRFARAAISTQPVRLEYPLPLDGSVDAAAFGARFAARAANMTVESDKSPAAAQIWVRLESLEPPLVVRNRRPGDRIEPAGLGGRKKLQDVLVDGKVPASLRDTVPIVADGRGVLWVVGHAVDKRCLRAPAGETCVILEMIHAQES
jgi:tRNA(Ile)-lysidine synthase